MLRNAKVRKPRGVSQSRVSEDLDSIATQKRRRISGTVEGNDLVLRIHLPDFCRKPARGWGALEFSTGETGPNTFLTLNLETK